MKYKKAFLFAFILLEVLICLALLYVAYFFLIKPYGLFQRFLTPSVSYIDSSNITIPKDSEYKYYWEYEPEQSVTVSESWLPEDVTYSINGDTLNDLRDYPIEKQQETFRVITLGDSFTFGYYVDTANNWPEQLESMLNSSECQYKNYEVINLAMPGFDVPYIVERYMKRGAKYDPDLVVWFEGGSGFTRHNDYTQPLVDECIDKNGIPHKIGAKENNACWKTVIEQLQQEYPRQALDAFMENSYSNLAAKTNVPVHFFYFQHIYKKYQDSIKGFDETFSDFEFFGSVPKLSSDTLLLGDSHPSSEGHKAIAETIFDQVCGYSN
jgi:lysophospholipase L1-like esterase